jgi:hypothetical protein
MPLNQSGKGGLGIVPRKFPHQIHVIRIGHLVNYPRCPPKVDNYFFFFRTGTK